MNPFLHPGLAALWIISLAINSFLVVCLLPKTRLPRFLFPFITFYGMWNACCLYLAFTLQDYPYFVVYWIGAYVADLLGLSLALSVGIPAVRAYQPKTKRLMSILSVLFCLTLGCFWIHKQTNWDVALYEHALRLLILGFLAVILSGVKMKGLRERERIVLLGLLALYGAGWAIAGWLSFLPASYTPSRGAMWALDSLIDSGVLGYWTWKRRLLNAP